jgi:acyl-coenzyme A synthetase/AMP-(fatty) acid ligase
VCWPELPRTATGKLLRRDVVRALVERVVPEAQDAWPLLVGPFG